jgi:ankyrin repeat protein
MFFKKKPLAKAIKKNDTAEVKKLLSAGADPNEKAYLVKAVAKGNAEMVKALLEAGANPTRKSPLSDAVEKDHGEIVKMLLEKTPTPDLNGLLELVALLVSPKAGKVLIEAGASAKGISICNAVAQKNYELVKLLVENGADANEMCSSSQNALYSALGPGHMYHPHKEMVYFLLDNGADPLFVSESNRLKFANTPGKFDLSLTTYNELLCPFFKALQGDDEMINKFLEKIDIEKSVKNGMNALYFACRRGPVSTVKYLIDKGMDIHKATAFEVSPFFFIGGKEIYEKIMLFKELGFDIHSTTKNEGYNLLHISVVDNNAEAVEACVKAGIDINSWVANKREYPQINALHLACANAKRDVALKLIELKADLNAIYKDEHSRQYTPMQIAKGGLIRDLEKAGARFHVSS